MLEKVKGILGLNDSYDEEEMLLLKPETIPKEVVVKSEPKPESKPETPKTESPKPERKPEPKPDAAPEQPKKPANQPQQKPAQKPRSQEQGFKVRTDVVFEDEDEKIIARILSEYKADKQKKDNKAEQPAMEAALATLVAFAEKDETFAKKFYRAAKKFAPKEYGAFFAIGGQLVPISAFKTLPEGITPEVHELKNGEPLPKPLSAEKAAGILPTLLSK